MRAITTSKLKWLAVTGFIGCLGMAASLWLLERVTTAQPAQAKSFSHNQHLTIGADLKCTDCHQPSAEGAVTLKRPYHDSCNKCHQDWFDAKPVKQDFCTVCHTEVKENEMPGMRAYPNYDKNTAILFDFSHKQHLHIKGAAMQKIGARVQCDTCHKPDAKGEKSSFPAHQECATCHDIEGIKPRLAADAKNEDCLGCHLQKEQNNPSYKKVRRFITDPARAQIARPSRAAWQVDASNPQGYGNTNQARDLKFSHDKHLKDSRNVGITCDTCHLRIDEKETVAELNIPSMWDCTICHESRRTSAAYRIDKCSVCHTQITGGNKPRNHTLTERPYDHTAAFRTRHAEAARAPEAKCAFCHEFVSDPRRRMEAAFRTEENYRPAGGSCDECHAVMKPKSHTIRWRNDLHGRMAAMNRQNCATCHQSDMCIRCHNTRPRSHNPLNAFVNGGHRFQAQLNQRSCFTCHDYAQTCERCHSRPLR